MNVYQKYNYSVNYFCFKNGRELLNPGESPHLGSTAGQTRCLPAASRLGASGLAFFVPNTPNHENAPCVRPPFGDGCQSSSSLEHLAYIFLPGFVQVEGGTAPSLGGQALPRPRQ